jgi:hypothetical protein
LEFVFVENVAQASALVNLHVMPVLSQHVNEFPHAPDTLLRTGFEPKDCPTRSEILRRVWQVFIEPVKNFSDPLPPITGKVTRIEKGIGRYKHALPLVGVFVNSTCDETEIHRANPFVGVDSTITTYSNRGALL